MRSVAGNIGNFTNHAGEEVEIEKGDDGKYRVITNDRVTQCNMTADELIGWFCNASNHYFPSSLEVKLGESYLTKTGAVVQITERIDEKEDPFAWNAGYRFRSSSGRNYTASGDHNDPSLCLVKKARLA